MRALIPLALVASLGGLGLSGCATTGAMDLTPEAAPAFVALAASTDRFEIESSRLALQRSRDPMIRMHAEMMIRDHGQTSAQLASAATSAGLAVPGEMLPMHSAMLAELTSAAAFDPAYRGQQLTSHQQALSLHQNYARNGSVPALRGAAASAVPVVRMHLDHLRRM
ncbi:DUF4142 domain-containing protein [Sphingomonas swuensis]|uniref:DUF4142 domain-containing protein n=1 Tax=Sphingomonas swuensis TaxID=977800 RepID=A0ABP7TCC2_9SPHN